MKERATHPPQGMGCGARRLRRSALLTPVFLKEKAVQKELRRMGELDTASNHDQKLELTLGAEQTKQVSGSRCKPHTQQGTPTIRSTHENALRSTRFKTYELIWGIERLRDRNEPQSRTTSEQSSEQPLK